MRLQTTNSEKPDTVKRAEKNIKLCHEWNTKMAEGRIRLPATGPYIMLDVECSCACNEQEYGDIKLNVYQSYQIKDQLKSRGYKYANQKWYKTFVSIEEANKEAEELHNAMNIQ